MGEIGIERREYLYDLTFSDLLLIERGYERRHRNLWSAHRWSTYYIMAAFCGSDNMKKSGINGPTDLMHLPWDNSDADYGGGGQPNADEVQRLRRLMEEENAKLQKS